MDFGRKNSENQEKTSFPGRRGSTDYPVRLENGKKMNMHVNRRGSVDVKFQRSRQDEDIVDLKSHEETSSEFATRFSKIRNGDEEEDTINRVQSALLARRVVVQNEMNSVFSSSKGNATNDEIRQRRRGYNTVAVLTGNTPWWRP